MCCGSLSKHSLDPRRRGGLGSRLEQAAIVEAPKSDRASARACAVPMREKITHKKKRVDSCGMLVQTTEIIALWASGSDPADASADVSASMHTAHAGERATPCLQR